MIHTTSTVHYTPKNWLKTRAWKNKYRHKEAIYNNCAFARLQVLIFSIYTWIVWLNFAMANVHIFKLRMSVDMHKLRASATASNLSKQNSKCRKWNYRSVGVLSISLDAFSPLEQVEPKRTKFKSSNLSNLFIMSSPTILHGLDYSCTPLIYI